MFNKWLAKREEKERKKSFYKGFGWAMSIYYLDKAPISEIQECLIFDDNDLEDDDAFDLGAQRAINQLTKENKT